MPSFDRDACQRIAAVVRAVEQHFRDLGIPLDTSLADSPLRWFLLVTALDPDTHEAEARFGVWDATADSGAGALAADVFMTTTVRDTTGQMALGEGAWVICRAIGSDNGTVWEILQGAGSSVQTGILNGPLTRRGTASVSIHTSEGDTGEDVEAVDWMLLTGETLPATSHVIIAYCADRWVVINSDCPP